ncbi:hypothetical protein TWF281_011290 [Arthrobotrys megalospora]
MNTLSTIPYDLFHEICGYLLDFDFLNLQLVSKTILSKLPPSRIESIRSRKTIFFTQKDIDALKHFASGSLESRRKIKHIIFDISYPYVTLTSPSTLQRIIGSYSRSTRVKLLEFCQIYETENRAHRRSRALRNNVSKITSSFSKILRRPRDYRATNQPLGSQAPSRGVEANLGNRPGPDHEDDALGTTLSPRLFSILARNELSRPEPPHIDNAFYENFCQALTETFKTLPNLTILEVRFLPRTEIAQETLSSIWKRYNPHIKYLHINNPEIESLPWYDWFEHSMRFGQGPFYPRPDFATTYDNAYSTLVASAVLALRQISEIRTNICYALARGKFIGGIETHWFQMYPLNRSKDDAACTQFCNHAFANLTRVEISISPWIIHDWNPLAQASPAFLDLILNAQDLIIGRPVYWDYLCDGQPTSAIPSDLILPNLRRLEMIEAAIPIDPLVQLLRINKGSLRQLVCRSTFSEPADRDRIIRVLTVLENELDLKFCKIDFLTSDRGNAHCYLCIEVKGSQRMRRYRLGTRCGPQCAGFISSSVPVPSTEERESMVKTYWTEKGSWGEFVGGIREIEAPESCGSHWTSTFIAIV